MGKSVSGIGRGLPLLRENLCVVAAMATDEFLPKLLRRNVPPQLTLDHVSPATRLLEKRRQKIEVQEALEAQKADFSRFENLRPAFDPSWPDCGVSGAKSNS